VFCHQLSASLSGTYAGLWPCLDVFKEGMKVRGIGTEGRVLGFEFGLVLDLDM